MTDLARPNPEASRRLATPPFTLVPPRAGAVTPVSPQSPPRRNHSRRVMAPLGPGSVVTRWIKGGDSENFRRANHNPLLRGRKAADYDLVSGRSIGSNAITEYPRWPAAMARPPVL